MSRYYPPVTEPPRGPAAFAEISEVTSQSQAAILLHLARQLREDDASRRDRLEVAEAPAASDLPEGESFPVPRLQPSHGAFPPQAVQSRAKAAYGSLSARRPGAMAKAFGSCAERLYQHPHADTAAELMEMCLRHPRELVRIAAAYAYFPLTAEPGRCVRHLVRGLKSADALEADLAATALAQVSPEHTALRRLSRRRPPRGGRRPAHTLTLVHGTWASDADWYQPPAGDFFSFVRGLRPDLYGGADFFSWSGGYSDGARAQGAVDLKAWVDDHNEDGLDIIGHSHGANVILRATQLGMNAGKVVLLSCPVHTSKYFPDLARVRQRPVHSVRVKLDLVILADRGGQRFHDPAIQEHVLPIWFDHSASHEPAVWQAHGIAGKVGL